MPRSSCAAVLAASLLLAAPAAADEVWTGEMREVAHDVEARVQLDRVEMTVRRAFVNRGHERQALWLSIDLPDGAVARELRVRTGDRWHQATLLEANAAEKRYFSEKPGPKAPDQDPALLSWESRGKVLLRVHAIEPGALAAVEYELLVPARADAGQLHFGYPRPAEGMAMPAVRIIPPHPGDRASIDDEPITPGIARPLSLEPPARSGASALSSPVEVNDPPAELSAARVRVFASHRRYSDLVFELRDPSGAVQALPTDRDHLVAGVTVEPSLLESTEGTWRLAVHDRATGATGTLHGWRLELTGGDGRTTTYRSRRPLPIPDALFDPEGGDVGEVDIAVTSHPAALEAGYGRVDLAGGGALFRFHADAPAKLGAVPGDLRVVFVLDASRSMSPEDTKTQLDAVAAYLDQAPGARFEIVRFDRRARRLIGRFAAAGDFAGVRASLEKSGALARANGSALERGLAAAAAALAGAGGTPRIVVVSDLLVRSRFRNAMALRALGRGRRAVTHLATLNGVADGAYERLDDHPLAAIAASRGGMTVSLPTDDAEALRRGALALIRPIQIDHLAISGPPGPLAPALLGEGQGLRILAHSDNAAPRAVTLAGLLWQRPVRRVVAGSRVEGDRVAALVFGDLLYGSLAEPQIEPLARRGHVVSPATSLLTTRPGERTRLGFGRVYGASCLARCGGAIVGHSTIRAKRRPLDLTGPLRRCAARLPAGAPLDAVAHVETSYREIVDVRVEGAAPLARCLTEEIWKLELPPAQSAGSLRQHRVELSRASLAAAP